MNMNVFSWLLSFFKLRERESGKRNLGVKEKCPQSYLSYSTGFHWRIFLLSRANRLCSVFNTGLKDLESFVSQLVFCLQPGVKWLWSVCHEPCSKNLLFCPLLPLRGREPHFCLGSPPIIWPLSLFPLPMSGDLRSLSVNIWSLSSVTHIPS